MFDLWFICYIYIVFIIIIIILLCTSAFCTTNQDVENMYINCNTNSDLGQETFENPVVMPLVDFAHLCQDFSMSDLPPSYDSCALESKPPSNSSTILIQHQ